VKDSVVLWTLVSPAENCFVALTEFIKFLVRLLEMAALAAEPDDLRVWWKAEISACNVLRLAIALAVSIPICIFD
jgi:hypothetical protein